MEQIATVVGIFDRSNPRSLWNLVWNEFRERMAFLEVHHAEDLLKSEAALKKELDPGVFENRVRLRFWEEYEEVQDRDLERMRMKNVIKGVCSEHVWKERVMRDPKVVLWICCPPVDYVTAMREILYFGLEELREAMARPFIEKKLTKDNVWLESVNLGLIDRKIEIFKMLDQRINGAVIQRVAIQQQIDNRVTMGPSRQIEDVSHLDREIERVKRSIEGIVSRDTLSLAGMVGQTSERTTESETTCSVEASRASASSE